MDRVELAYMLEATLKDLNRHPVISGYSDTDNYLQGCVERLKNTIEETLTAIEESYDVFDKERYTADPMDIRKAKLEMEEI